MTRRSDPSGRSAACVLAGVATCIALGTAAPAAALDLPRGDTVETLTLVVDATPSEAASALEALRERAHRNGDRRSEGLALWGLAAVRLQEGHPAEARELAAAGRETLQAAGDRSAARDAAALEGEAERLLEGGEPQPAALTAHVRERLGMLEFTRFRLGEALRHFDAGLDGIEGKGHTGQEAGLHAYRGMVLALFQRFEPAQADLDRFVELAVREAPELEPLVTLTRELVLGLATWEWEPTIRELERIEELYGDRLPPWFSDNLEFIGHLQEGRVEAAAGACRAVLSAGVAANPDPSGSPEAAMEMACAALDVVAAVEEGGDLPTPELLTLAASASRLVQSQPEPVREALGALMGEFLKLAAQPEQRDHWAAEIDFQETLSGLQTLLARATPPEMRSGVDAPFSQFVGFFAGLKADAGDPEAAFELAEEARARELLDRLVDARLATADPDVAERIAALREERDALGRRLVEARRDGAAEESLADLEAELAGVRRELDAIFDRLALRSTGGPARRQPLPVEEIQDALGQDTTLVAYLAFADGLDDTLAWVVDQDRVEQVTLPIRIEELEGKVAYFLETLRRRESVDRLAEFLYGKLWAPLQDRIRTRRVLLVPDGPLQDLPFAALRDPDRGQWLAQQATLLQAPSATAWVRLSRRGAGSGPPLVLGDGGEDLPAATEAARTVSSLWGVAPLVGADATEEAFRSLAPGAPLVHVSTHGVADPHDPLFSRLRLAPSPAASPGPSRDGRLELHEVVNELDLAGTGLVVLPACETGRGPRTLGGEVTNLARAFLLAGARGALTARWDVEDAGAAALMVDLHRHLVAGTEAAEALRRAQEAALASVDRNHPWFWAGFSLHGAGGPVRAHRPAVDPVQPSTTAGVQPEEQPGKEGDPWRR